MLANNPEFARFAALDLNAIKYALTLKRNGPCWTIERTEAAERDYKRFLFLNLRYPHKRMVPTKDVDDFWHAHILDTEKYVHDCERLFGGYLHHFPYFGLGGENDLQEFELARMETDRLYLAEFDCLPLGAGEGMVCNGSRDIGFNPTAQDTHARLEVSEIYAQFATDRRQ